MILLYKPLCLLFHSQIRFSQVLTRLGYLPEAVPWLETGLQHALKVT